jgi:hypothetical protein
MKKKILFGFNLDSERFCNENEIVMMNDKGKRIQFCEPEKNFL